MTELYTMPGDIEHRKERKITVFPPEEQVVVVEETKEDKVAVYDDIKTLISASGSVVDDLEKVAEAFSIPILESEAEVRAAHLQLGGDGLTIKFQEYAAAIHEHMKRRGDYLNEDFNGLGSGDAKRINATRANRHAQPDENDKSLAIFDELMKYGSNAVLLFLLNEQIGLFHSTDHSQVTSGKLPPGTEVGGILAQIIKGMVMLKFVQGMTDGAIDQYQNMDQIFPEGFDVNTIMEEFKKAGPPKSDAYGFYRAQMASSNHEIMLTYSVRYCTQHIGEGFESWLGYLTGRAVHEDSLRTYFNGREYRGGAIELSKAHRDVIRKKFSTGSKALDVIGAGLGRQMDWGETCCFLRFIDIFTPNILAIMKSIINMSIISLNWQAQQSFDWYLGLANHPWSVISEKLLKMLDGLFDKVIEELLDAMEIDNETLNVLRACTPISELLDSLLSQIVSMKEWYHQIIRVTGLEVDKSFRQITKGWQIVYQVRRAKEILFILDELIERAEVIVDVLEHSEAELAGLVGKLQGSVWSHMIPTANPDTINTESGFTDSALDWCRKIGDWDYISKQIGAGIKEIA